MLRRIEIDNYKMFENFTLDFTEGVNIICGPNGSGKSSLLELMHSLTGFLATNDVSDSVNYSVMEAFPFRSFCRWKVQDNGYGDMTICVTLGDEHESFRYKLTVRFDFRDNRNRVQEESLVLISQGDERQIISFSEGMINMKTDDNKELSFRGDRNISGLIMGSNNNSRIRDFAKMMAEIYALRLDPNVVMKDFKTDALTLELRGERFSAWQYKNINTIMEKYTELKEHYKYFIPGLSNFNNTLIGDLRRWKVNVEYKEKNYELEFRELSDGQKMLIVLYSLLVFIPDGSTLIIDEPENYLAPGELQPWLFAVNDAWEERGIQFILITHNPKTLNWYHKEAFIFRIQGEPPRIVAEPNSNDMSETLFNKLCEMEWENSE